MINPDLINMFVLGGIVAIGLLVGKIFITILESF